MGRDKPKKYNKMGYFQKQAYHDEQAKKYNINKDDFTNSTGGDRYESFDEGGYKKAIKNAMRMADFDYRASAPHMDGVKGDASFNDYSKYERSAVKLHRQAGNEGDYSSNKDITGVTNNLVNDYQKNLTKDYALNADLEALKQEMNNRPDTTKENTLPAALSETASKAREKSQDYELNLGNSGTDIFGGGSPQQQSDAQSYSDEYKTNIAGALKLSGKETRGPKAGLVPGEGY
jgi:hypothetical protein